MNMYWIGHTVQCHVPSHKGSNIVWLPWQECLHFTQSLPEEKKVINHNNSTMRRIRWHYRVGSDRPHNPADMCICCCSGRLHRWDTCDHTRLCIHLHQTTTQSPGRSAHSIHWPSCLYSDYKTYILYCTLTLIFFTISFINTFINIDVHYNEGILFPGKCKRKVCKQTWWTTVNNLVSVVERTT